MSMRSAILAQYGDVRLVGKNVLDALSGDPKDVEEVSRVDIVVEESTLDAMDQKSWRECEERSCAYEATRLLAYHMWSEQQQQIGQYEREMQKVRGELAQVTERLDDVMRSLHKHSLSAHEYFVTKFAIEDADLGRGDRGECEP